MKIIEAKNGLVKFETEQKYNISSFCEIKDTINDYIGQIIKCTYNGASHNCLAKIMYNYKGELLPYDRKTPSLDAEITPIALSLISETFNNDNPITIGKFIDETENIKIDETFLDKKTLVISDKPENLTALALSLKKQYDGKEQFIIIDADNSINCEKYIAGVDFKLPLNTEALDFIYNECLSDATTESKSTIKDIFKDLADYSKTVPFVPFEALKSVVDNMVNNLHVFKLIVLKNKLEKFDKLKYFASTAEEAQKLDDILNSKNAVIDLSNLEQEFLSKYLEVIYSKIKNIKKARTFVKMSNCVNKKSFKIMFTSETPTLFAIGSGYKFINSIPSLFSNFIIDSDNKAKILFPPLKQIQNTENEEMIVCGESTNNVPIVFISKFDIATETSEPIVNTQVETAKNPIEEAPAEIETANEEITQIEEPECFMEEEVEVEEESVGQEEQLIEESPFSERSHEDFHTKIDSLKTEILEQEIVINNEVPEITQNSEEQEVQDMSVDIFNSEEDKTEGEEENLVVEVEQEVFDDSLTTDEDADNINENENILPDYQPEEINSEVIEPEVITQEEENPEIMDVMPIEDSDFQEDTVVELDNSEISSDDIIVEMDEDIIEDINSEESEDVEQEIVDDVDKVYTTVKDDTITDVDLDLIDELNNLDSEDISPITSDEDDELLLNASDTEELGNTFTEEIDSEDFTEPLTEVSDSQDNTDILETKNSSTPIVPVYEAEIPQEDRVVSDAIEQGDTVVHAKYGTGVVEKMIKYGNKNLYSINFDNVGRRLLDPALTEIKKA